VNKIKISLSQLRGMIGVKLIYNNRPCQVIEVIENSPSLILQFMDKDIQNNQFGNAHRFVPETCCIPVLSENNSELSPLFLSLDLL